MIVYIGFLRTVLLYTVRSSLEYRTSYSFFPNHHNRS